MKKSVIIIRMYAVYLPTFSAQGKSLPMSLQRQKQADQSGFFQYGFSRTAAVFLCMAGKRTFEPYGSSWMKYLPLFLYTFRWNIETSYYEPKTFWDLCSYMVRSSKGIEMVVNLINISYCAMKLLPYQDRHFSKYHGKSVQEFRFVLSEGIRRQLFFLLSSRTSKPE